MMMALDITRSQYSRVRCAITLQVRTRVRVADVLQVCCRCCVLQVCCRCVAGVLQGKVCYTLNISYSQYSHVRCATILQVRVRVRVCGAGVLQVCCRYICSGVLHSRSLRQQHGCVACTITLQVRVFVFVAAVLPEVCCRGIFVSAVLQGFVAGVCCRGVLQGYLTLSSLPPIKSRALRHYLPGSYALQVCCRCVAQIFMVCFGS